MGVYLRDLRWDNLSAVWLSVMVMGDCDEVGGKVISLVVTEVGGGDEAFSTYKA
jgi:hypothetical protein